MGSVMKRTPSISIMAVAVPIWVMETEALKLEGAIMVKVLIGVGVWDRVGEMCVCVCL